MVFMTRYFNLFQFLSTYSIFMISVYGSKSIPIEEPPNIYRWIEEKADICSIAETLPYKFLGFLNESMGLSCDICPKIWPLDIPKMACAEVVLNDTGRQFVCHEIPPTCIDTLKTTFKEFYEHRSKEDVKNVVTEVKNLFKNTSLTNLTTSTLLNDISRLENLTSTKSIEMSFSQDGNSMEKDENLESNREDSILPMAEMFKNLLESVKFTHNFTLSPLYEVLTMSRSEGRCSDTHETCCFWSLMGECDNNPSYMGTLCPQSCGQCGCAPKCITARISCSTSTPTTHPTFDLAITDPPPLPPIPTKNPKLHYNVVLKNPHSSIPKTAMTLPSNALTGTHSSIVVTTVSPEIDFTKFMLEKLPKDELIEVDPLPEDLRKVRRPKKPFVRKIRPEKLVKTTTEANDASDLTSTSLDVEQPRLKKANSNETPTRPLETSDYQKTKAKLDKKVKKVVHGAPNFNFSHNKFSTTQIPVSTAVNPLKYTPESAKKALELLEKDQRKTYKNSSNVNHMLQKKQKLNVEHPKLHPKGKNSWSFGYWLGKNGEILVKNPNIVPLGKARQLTLALPITEKLEMELIENPTIRKLLEKIIERQKSSEASTKNLQPINEQPFHPKAKLALTRIEKYGNNSKIYSSKTVNQNSLKKVKYLTKNPIRRPNWDAYGRTPKVHRTTPSTKIPLYGAKSIENSSYLMKIIEESTSDLPSKEETKKSCYDYHNLCKFWADKNECSLNPFWMRLRCPKSCNSCGEKLEDIFVPEPRKDCHNFHKLCPFWWFNGECEKNIRWMMKNCQLSCVCMQKLPSNYQKTFYKNDSEFRIFV